MTNLPRHMIGHIIVMFMVPMGLICSGSARSTWWLLDTAMRRRVLRWWYVERSWHAPKWLRDPFAAMVALNIVMVVAHVPRVFDAIMEHPWAMDWVMEPAFLFSGLFFFHYIISSPPRRNRVRLSRQLVMVVLTMIEMLVLAMAMSIFTKTSWYSVMDPGQSMAGMPGMGSNAPSLLQVFHEQQLAAAILWICGDFWAVPCLVVIVRRAMMRDGSILGVLERQFGAFSGASR